jgi:hypothetical protein
MSSDFQKQLLYDWENGAKWRYRRTDGSAKPVMMTTAECRALARRALLAYGCTMVSFRVASGRSSHGGPTRIRLARTHHVAAIVLHETAHSICAQRGNFVQHGPVFVRMFIELLATYMGLNKGELLRSARAYGLKVAPWSALKRRPAL